MSSTSTPIFDQSHLPKDVRLVHALMTLRHITPQELSSHTGIQIENLQAWLKGTASALALRSYIALLTYLGLNREGLSKTYVQHWDLDATSAFTQEQRTALQQVAPWLTNGAMIEILGDWQPIYGKTRIFAIRGDTFKILIAVKSGFRMPIALDPTLIPGVSYRTTPDNKPPELRVDPLYWNAVRTKAITPAEFDDLFFETALECSWNDLRLMARERGLTPSMLAKDILTKDIAAEEAASHKTEVSVAERASSSVTTPAKTRRRPERLVVEVAQTAQAAPKTVAMPLPASIPLQVSARRAPIATTVPTTQDAVDIPVFEPPSDSSLSPSHDFPFDAPQDVFGLNKQNV